MDHFHSNAHGLLGDGLATIQVLERGELTNVTTANKFYKIQSKGSGSNGKWRVTEVYEGNPRLESESYTSEQKCMYMPVTQSYEFPPMDITIKRHADQASYPAFKLITQNAIEGEGDEGIPEQSITFDNIKFAYTASTGAHWISGSRNIATDNNSTVTIQSNTHPSIKLQWRNAERKYHLLYNNQSIFYNFTAGTTYNTLYNNVSNKAGVDNQLWRINDTFVDVEENGVPRVVAIGAEEPTIQGALIFFSGSNLAEGIS